MCQAEPIKIRVPLRRFGYDAKYDLRKCPRGRIPRPAKPIKHGRLFCSKATDCARCPLKGDVCRKDAPTRWWRSDMTIRRCSGPGAVRRAGARVISGLTGVIADVPTTATARLRPGTGSRVVRRGLDDMKIQASPTAAAIDIKRLVADLLAIFGANWTAPAAMTNPSDTDRARRPGPEIRMATVA